VRGRRDARYAVPRPALSLRDRRLARRAAERRCSGPHRASPGVGESAACREHPSSRVSRAGSSRPRSSACLRTALCRVTRSHRVSSPAFPSRTCWCSCPTGWARMRCRPALRSTRKPRPPTPRSPSGAWARAAASSGPVRRPQRDPMPVRWSVSQMRLMRHSAPEMTAPRPPHPQSNSLVMRAARFPRVSAHPANPHTRPGAVLRALHHTGRPEPGARAATVAVNVTAWPCTLCSTLDTSVV